MKTPSSLARPLRSSGIVVLLLALVLSGCTGFRAARLYQTGTAALDAGDSERALRELQQAAHLAPEASEIQNHLGLALAAAGHHEKALAAFERAVDLDCSNAAATRNLAAARARRAAEAAVAGMEAERGHTGPAPGAP